MPLVSRDEQQPARWWPARVAWAFVRDGNRLLACRRTRSTTEILDAPLKALGTAPWFARFRRESTRGARVVAGLEPHRVLLRELESPLRNPRKSSEIWPSLLDATLPFPLEDCRVAFLAPRPRPEGGLRCLAVAARENDLRAAIREWEALGIHPDLLLPEAPLLGDAPAVWQGSSRAVFSARREDRLLGAGGSLDPATRSAARVRFFAAWGIDTPAELDPAHLPATLALAALRPLHGAVNLRAGSLASPAFASRLHRARRTLRVALLLLGVLFLTGPHLLVRQIRADRLAALARAATAYQALTGQPSPAPGQERLLARRFLEEQAGPLRETAAALALPRLTPRLADLVAFAQLTGVLLHRVHLYDDRLDLHFQAPEDARAAFLRRLSEAGWALDPLPPPDQDQQTLSAHLPFLPPPTLP